MTDRRPSVSDSSFGLRHCITRRSNPMPLSTVARNKSRRITTLGLPPSWYLDPAVFDVERRELFDNGPTFVGRSQMVPRDGDYIALEGANAGLLLVRDRGHVRLA